MRVRPVRANTQNVERHVWFDEPTLAVLYPGVVLTKNAVTAFLEYSLATCAAMLPAGHAGEPVAAHDLVVR